MSLTVSATNPRYFEDASGNIVYLAGYYDTFVPQDPSPANPLILGWDSILASCVSAGANFMRLTVRHRTGSTPWTFTASGSDVDLTAPSATYTARLRACCQEAATHGIYCSVMLFNGWDLAVDSGSGWNTFFFNPSNNINSINGDWYDGDGKGLEVNQYFSGTTADAIRAIQLNYIHAVVDALYDLDNIIWECSNEDIRSTANTTFQQWVRDAIAARESTHGTSHPLGFTSRYPDAAGDMAIMLASDADWVAPGVLDSPSWDPSAPPVNTGTKVILYDFDHFQNTQTADLVWKTALRGHNPVVMNCYDGPTVEAGAIAATGHTRQYLARLTLASVTPSSSGYILSWNGREYLIYSPNTGSFVVSLASGNYTIEWFNPTTGVVASTGNYVAVDGNNTLNPPFSGASVCLLNRVLLSASHESSNFLWNYSHSLGPLPTEFRISYGSEPGTIDGTVSAVYGISSKLISEVLPAPGTYFVSIAAWNSSYGAFASGTSVYLTSLVGSQADITLNFR